MANDCLFSTINKLNIKILIYKEKELSTSILGKNYKSRSLASERPLKTILGIHVLEIFNNVLKKKMT